MLPDYLKNFDNDIQDIIDKKANSNEIISYLNTKADLNDMTQLMEKKVSRTEFENFKLNLEKIHMIYPKYIIHLF